MKTSRKQKIKGFTLIELLVTTAVMGLLAVVSANIISSVLKSQNKTTMVNEVRQNGDLVIAKLERDIRQAQGVTQITARRIRVNIDGTDVVWRCSEEVLSTTSGVFRRADRPVTNNDPEHGVSVRICSFNVLGNPGTGTPQIVRLEFHLKQAVHAPQQAEFGVDEPFEVTVGTRAYATD